MRVSRFCSASQTCLWNHCPPQSGNPILSLPLRPRDGKSFLDRECQTPSVSHPWRGSFDSAHCSEVVPTLKDIIVNQLRRPSWVQVDYPSMTSVVL